MDSNKTVKYLRDAIPLGPHPEPHAEWIQVRLDVVQAAIKQIEAAQGATMEVTAALEYVDHVRTVQFTEVTYETYQRSNFRRKDGARRKYTLADARKDAATAAIRIRNAWELLDPISPHAKPADAAANRTALGNCQTQIAVAIGHLQAVLNKARTHADQQAADTAARDWLTSIGSEPS